MDIKLLLVRSITLLYQESVLEEKRASTSKPLIRKMLEHIRMPESAADDGLERNAIVHLRATLLWMISNNDSQAYDKNELLQRLRVNCANNDTLYDAFLTGVVDFDDKDYLLKVVKSGRASLKAFESQKKAEEILKKASHAVAFRANDIQDWGIFLNTTIGDLAAIDVGGDVKSDPAFVKSISLKDRSTVLSAFKDMEDSLSDFGTVKFPFIAANNMMGEVMAMRRGEFHLWNALPHNYKSGWLMDIFVGACLFNDPFVFDETKKGCIALFSSEDDAPVIMQKLYTILKQIETGCAVKVKQIDIEEATDYVCEKLTARGWEIEIHRVRPSLFTYQKYLATLEDMNSRGLEVALVVCDYLSMFNKDGCNNASTGDDIQDLFRRVREYATAKKILHITAHQLSTQAKEEKRINGDKFIHLMPGKGYYEGCKKLDTEVDFEGYLNKVVVNNGTFLEVLWGKHRKVGPTMEKAKYFVLKFLEYPQYGLQYDFGKEDSSYRVVGGKPNTEGGGAAWDDLDD